MKEKSDFGIFIQRLRRKRNLSQKELANKLGVGYPRISNLETSIIYPTDNILKKYSDFFDVPLEELQELAIADREVFKLREIGNRIAKYKNQIANIYDQSDNKDKLADVIKEIGESEQRLETIIDTSFTSRELLVPYFPTILAFKKFVKSKSKKDIKNIQVVINPNSYVNADNIIGINVSTSIKSMNRIIPEQSDVFIELNTDIDFGDIVFYSIYDEYGLGRLQQIKVDDESSISLICFDSLDSNYSQYIILDKNVYKDIHFIGKVIDVNIPQKLLHKP